MEVRPAAQDHVAPAADQLLAGQVDRGQGGCAGGVDGVVGPTEVEPVGDAPGNHVAQHPGEGVLGQRRQVLVDGRRQRAEIAWSEGPEDISAGKVRCALDAEDHGRA